MHVAMLQAQLHALGWLGHDEQGAHAGRRRGAHWNPRHRLWRGGPIECDTT